MAMDCVNTLRINRKNVPPYIKNKNLETGEIISQYTGPILILKW